MNKIFLSMDSNGFIRIKDLSLVESFNNTSLFLVY